MDWKQKAERWLQFEGLDKVVRQQLDNIKDDEKGLEEAFYKKLGRLVTCTQEYWMTALGR